MYECECGRLLLDEKKSHIFELSIHRLLCYCCCWRKRARPTPGNPRESTWWCGQTTNVSAWINTQYVFSWIFWVSEHGMCVPISIWFSVDYAIRTLFWSLDFVITQGIFRIPSQNWFVQIKIGLSLQLKLYIYIYQSLHQSETIWGF